MAVKVTTSIGLREDNNACISFVDHLANHRNSKYQLGNTAMQYVTTADQIADIFTKALDPVMFIRFRYCLVVL